MGIAVQVNGRITGERDAVVSVFDHGFVFGEGVYEVLRTYHGQPFLFDAHARRLRESARRIALDVPFSDEELRARIDDTLQASGADGERYIRVLLTRGVGEFTYDPKACPTPTLVIIVKPHVTPPPEVYERGVTISLVDVTRNHPRSINPLIKSNNLLNNALGMQQACARGSFEALMKNYLGEIVECSQSNVFLVRRGEVLTPPIDAGLLAGITRAFVFDLGREIGLPVREARVLAEDLPTAEEMFITSSTREIVPVVRVDDLVVGTGVPGPVTTALLARYRAHVAALAPSAAGG